MYDEKIKFANEMIGRLNIGVHVNDTETQKLIKKMAWYACVCNWMTEEEALKHRNRFMLLRLHHICFGLPEVKSDEYAKKAIFLPKKAKGEIKLPEFMQAK